MKQIYGTSQSGNLKEAVKGISNPKLILLLSNQEKFKEHVAELAELYLVCQVSGVWG